MGSVLIDGILSGVIFAVIVLILVFVGIMLVKKGIITRNGMKRAVISVVVFAVIYWSADFVIGWSAYDVYVKAIEFLAAVIGAGCYWIGSNTR